MAIDHIGLAVSDYRQSKAFYTRALAPLGMELVVEIGTWAGFGKNGKGDFWFGVDEIAQSPMHIAFRAESRAIVDQFYTESIAAGGRDNGKPGLRPRYHAHYYGAFVIDPDGHNIEAVCHQAQ